MEKIIGIGEYAVSNSMHDIIKTFALASCVAVTAYSPMKNAAGMVHIALPFPPTANDEIAVSPGYYATTAVPLLISMMRSEFGCLKGELRIELFGGAKSIRKDDVFNIGQSNLNAIKEILNDLNLSYSAEETGGTLCRTLELDVATGRVKVALLPIAI